MPMRKIPERMRALDALRHRFGDELVVVDHWEEDLAAVGVARRGAEQRLAYILAKTGSEQLTYHVALENPPEPTSDLPYADAGSHDDLSLADAVNIIAGHLGFP